MNLKWQTYFMRIARVIAQNSKCMSRQIGVVVVRDKSILSTGYNGPPRGVPHCDDRMDNDVALSVLYYRAGLDKITKCPRQELGYASGEALELCPATHAEVNAIANAAKEGISLRGAIMLMTCGIPCRNCLATIINSGISEIIVSSTELYDKTSEFILNNSELIVTQYEGD